VLLNRPDKHNGVDLEVIDGLLAAAAGIGRDRLVRAVIIHGAGPSFCAGLDIKAVMGKPARAAWAALALFKPTANRFQRVNLCWRDLSVPVIAAIEGNCFGAGMQLALGADIRLATPDAQLSVMEAKWGLVPDMGGTVLLREVVAKDVAMDLTMSPRIVSGQEALALGLVTRLADDPLAAARELAQEYAARSPDAVAGGKHLLHEAWATDESSALAAERRWQVRMLRSKNQRIATRRNTKEPEASYVERSW
jgi:enoyl-CoA hydratase/carnithine racemase